MSNLKLTVLSPPKPLQHCVRRILITIGDEDTDEILPIGPTGFAYLTYSRYPPVINYAYRRIEKEEQLFMVSQLDKEQPYFEINGPLFHIGLEILPTTPFYYFGVEGGLLTDDFITLEDHFPAIAEGFKKQVENENDPLKVAAALEQLLLDQPKRESGFSYLDKALDIIYKRSGNIDLPTLIDEINISERHFRRIFKKVIGIGPKQYSKVVQFNAVFEAIQRNQENELYDMALKHGYYDHAHFINDFKKLLGQSPRQFLKSDHDFLKTYLGNSTKH